LGQTPFEALWLRKNEILCPYFYIRERIKDTVYNYTQLLVGGNMKKSKKNLKSVYNKNLLSSDTYCAGDIGCGANIVSC